MCPIAFLYFCAKINNVLTNAKVKEDHNNNTHHLPKQEHLTCTLLYLFNRVLRKKKKKDSQASVIDQGKD